MTTIHCPHCKEAISIEDALVHDLKNDFQAKLEMEKKRLQTEALDSLQKQRKVIESQLSVEMKEKYVLEMDSLRQQNEARGKELTALKSQELLLRKQKQELEEARQSLDLQVQRKLDEERKSIAEKARLQEREQSLMQLKQKDQTLDNLKSQIEELQKKAEQGSQQAQGEVQEVEIEKLLTHLFPLDVITEVQKGVNGADVIHTVNNNQGKRCGSICIESKRTKSFQQKWIDKLKEDMLREGSELGVIVTEAMPDGESHIVQVDCNIWVCPFAEFKGLAFALRDGMLRVDLVRIVQGNSREKMRLLFEYLTSPEFKQQLEIIFGGFRALESNLTKEKRAMQRLWKEREKQLEKIYSNAIDFYGSVSGIAGSDVPIIEALELDEPLKSLPLVDEED